MKQILHPTCPELKPWLRIDVPVVVVVMCAADDGVVAARCEGSLLTDTQLGGHTGCSNSNSIHSRSISSNRMKRITLAAGTAAG